MHLKTNDYNYDLQEGLIAQNPKDKRDESRLLVFNAKTNQTEHKQFFDIVNYLQSGDVLVMNEAKVLPVRLIGKKTQTGACIEFLLTKRLSDVAWEALVKPAKKLKEETLVEFGEKLTATVGKDAGFAGGKIVHFSYNGVFEEILNEIGSLPLPHYIKTKLEDNSKYNTVYAQQAGSSAAPTAGLHFTNALLKQLEEKGVQIIKVLLHVGIGTFRPVKADNILQHEMHSESYEITAKAANAINRAKKEGRRIVCVGTTSVRTLESATGEDGLVKAGAASTSIFIYEGYKFKCCDGLITNFHLPKSTLLMLVAAFIGYNNAMQVYQTAVKEEYRFFSFGDACLFFKEDV